VRHCTESELAQVVSLDDAMAALEHAFVARAQGAAPVQMRCPTDYGGLRLNTMAAVIPALGVCGAKVYTAVSSKFCFVVLLFSIEDGRLLASLEANGLTRLRTAAVSALAVRHLARPESRTLAIYGTGTQAQGHAAALAATLPLAQILVVGRAGAVGFARDVEAATGIGCTVVEAAEAAQRADVVVTATRARTPLFDGAQLRQGACVVAVGSARPDAAEVDARTFQRASLICVEDAGQARHEAGDLIAASQAGVPVWDRLVELGAIVAGQASGRRSPEEITVFESLGFALEDIAIAALAWSRLEKPSSKEKS
jgi:ornithine cyclodeaminase